MKNLKAIIPFLLLSLNANEDFISPYEYGQMLYNNPRGVSCIQCHGENAEGRVIVRYEDSQGEKLIKGADIRFKTLKEMIRSVNAYHEVMPRYYLTNKEVKMIYEYLQEKNKEYLMGEE
jgi:mono/diheme cytochrome c family protein